MHMGVHYPSDVFAGALLGAGSAWISYQANKKMNSYWIKKKLTKTF
jgi:membrane-associated phospholipid phosphatase